MDFTPIPTVRERYPLQKALQYRNAPIQFIQDHLEQLGDCFAIPFGGRRLVVINEPSYIKHVFQANHSNYIKAPSYRKLRMLLGNGLFTSEGDEWLKHRRLIQPTFHKVELSHFVDLMSQEAAKLVHRWGYLYRGGTPFSLAEEMSEITLSIVCEALLGQRLEEGAKVVNQELPKVLDFMIHRVLSPVSLPIWLPTRKHRAFSNSKNKLGKLIATLIRHKQEGKNTQLDLLSTLLQVKDKTTGAPLSHQQIIDEMMTFFLAGHETSAVAISWALVLLDQHDSWTEKARIESTKLLEGGISPHSLMHQAPVLKQICQETLRLYPPAWTLAREALAADRIGPYQLDKGDSIVVNSYCLHRTAAYWKSPNDFNPARFDPRHHDDLPHKYAYVPFGAGPRLCIGQHFALFEMQVILAHILANYQVNMASENPSFSCSLTLRPQTSIPITVQHL